MIFGNKKKPSYTDEIIGKRVLVIGAGKSGTGSVHLLNRVGAYPVLLEQNPKATVSGIREKLDYDDRETEVFTGGLPEEAFDRIDAVVPSPGVPMDVPLLVRFREKGIPVLSEVELAYRFMKGKLIAITGTNGKTTTTSLVGEILKQTWEYGAEEVFVLGNIGESFSKHALETTEKSVTVAEISSFALEAVEAFRADVSAILNITPDHLDRHHTFENYAEIKTRITNRQTEPSAKGDKKSCVVLNYGDAYLRAFGEELEKRKGQGKDFLLQWFSSGETPPVPGCRFRLKNGVIETSPLLFGDVSESAPDFVPLLALSDCRLKGLCNAENVMAALTITLAMGVAPERAAEVVRGFKPVAHRIEYIATKNGVEYYNDSKATNPDSAVQGILAMDRPTILIAGGYDKGSDYDTWTALFEGRVKELVLVGETAEAIEKSARRNGFTQIHRAGTFEEALAYCTTQAGRGDAVLLSPACASWGMFANFEERGDRFRDYAESLAD